jgi:hypothetical protein
MTVVPTRLVNVVLDANDLPALSRWWAAALGWAVTFEESDEVTVAPPAGHPGVELTFGAVAEPKAGKNRVHLDLASESEDAQHATAERLVAAGARRLPSESFPWIVLADPEGNELCVLDPRPGDGDTGALASIVVDVDDPERRAPFWSAATGWPVVELDPRGARMRAPSGDGPFLDLVPVPEPKRVKNRVHLDVAPLAGEEHEAAVKQLEALGARRIDIGQGDVSWVVLADPEGQELCVLTPR